MAGLKSWIFACGGMEIMTPENLTSVYGVPVTLARMGPIPVIVPFIPGGP